MHFEMRKIDFCQCFQRKKTLIYFERNACFLPNWFTCKKLLWFIYNSGFISIKRLASLEEGGAFHSSAGLKPI